jgi:hypothetical protein
VTYVNVFGCRFNACDEHDRGDRGARRAALKDRGHGCVRPSCRRYSVGVLVTDAAKNRGMPFCDKHFPMAKAAYPECEWIDASMPSRLELINHREHTTDPLPELRCVTCAEVGTLIAHDLAQARLPEVERHPFKWDNPVNHRPMPPGFHEYRAEIDRLRAAGVPRSSWPLAPWMGGPDLTVDTPLPDPDEADIRTRYPNLPERLVPEYAARQRKARGRAEQRARQAKQRRY